MEHKRQLLITHDGKFHPDDVLAYTTLKLHFKHVDLIRTRTITEDYTDSNAIIFDVGGDGYKYDHHIVNKPFRKNGIPYSSFGLIWKDFGKSIIKEYENTLTETEIEEVFNIIDKQLVEGIDAVDNGMYENIRKKYNQYSLSAVLTSFNDDEGTDEAFLLAANVAEPILLNLLKVQISTILDRKSVLAAVAEQGDSPILVLDSNIMWKKCINSIPHILYVVSPTANKDKYKVRAVQNSKSLKPRKPLPASWAGLIDDELQKQTKVSDALFCHPGRFLAGAKTKAGAIQLAKTALIS